MISDKGQDVVQSPYLSRRGRFVPEWASWSIIEASQQTGYNEEYLRRLIRRGKVEAVKVGPAYLIRVDSLKEYIKSQDPADGRTGPRQRE